MEGKEVDSGPSGEKWIRFSSGEHGISIEYPSDWIKSEGQMGTAAAFVSPESHMISLNILVQPLPEGMGDLDDFTAKSLDQMKEMMSTTGGFNTEFNVKTTKICGQRGKRMVFEAPLGGSIIMKVDQAWTLKDNKGYIITFSQPTSLQTDNQHISEHMFKSLQWSVITPECERPLQTLFLTVNQSKEHLFELHCPNNWKGTMGTGYGPIYTYEYNGPITTREQVSYSLKLIMTVTPLPSPTLTVDQWNSIVTNNLSEQIVAGDLGESKEVKFGGVKGYEVKWKNSNSGRSIQVFTVHQAKIYTLLFTFNTPLGDDRPIPIYEAVKRTLTFLSDKTTFLKSNTFVYENLVQKVLFKFDAGWMPGEGVMGTVISFERGDMYQISCNVNLVISENDPSLKDLESFRKVVEDQLSLTKDSKILEEGDVIIGGRKAKRIVYLGNVNDRTFKFEQMYLHKDNKAYIISFSALEAGFEKERKFAKVLMESFRIIDDEEEEVKEQK